MGKPGLIFVASQKSTFILQDIKWLSHHYKVKTFFFKSTPKLFLPIQFVYLFFGLLFTVKAPMVSSFGGYHSWIMVLVAKIKHQKSYIILHGTDSVTLPEISYGYLNRFPIGWFCRNSYRKADALLPVSESLIETVNTYAFRDKKELGILKALPTLSTNYYVIPNGFDFDFWKLTSTSRSSDTYVSVISEGQELRKGLDLIIKSAERLPEKTFYIAGHDEISVVPKNVHFMGKLTPEELNMLYQKSSFYLQLSIYEGFGCALCEAMLCGCTPIVSSVNILPKLIGETGFVLKDRSEDSLVELLEKSSVIEPGIVRNQILSKFSIQNRINQLVKIIGT